MQVLSAHPRQKTGFSACEPLPCRLGQISFMNSLPVVLPIERGYVPLDAEVVLASPARLNALFAQGALDIGAMSSFYYLSQDNLTLVPGLSISCLGPVGSVLFFARVSPPELSGKKILVSSQSATSVNLLKILLLEHYGVEPLFIACDEPDLVLADVSGALIIGDRALGLDEVWEGRFYRQDLGQWWHETYDLPMVFGLWAARSEWVEGNPEKFEEISAALVLAKKLGLSELFASVLSESGRRSGLSQSRLEGYFRGQLNFELSQGHFSGLSLYRSLCAKYNLFGS